MLFVHFDLIDLLCFDQFKEGLRACFQGRVWDVPIAVP